MVTDEYASGLGDYTVTVTADAPADSGGAYGEVALPAAYKEVKVVPAAPNGFSATAGEVAGTVHLEWDASTSAIATGYRVLLDDGSVAGPQVVADGIAPDVTSFELSMLAEGTYTVALEAASEAGASAAATVSNVTVGPYVPPTGGGPGGTAVHSASSGALPTDGPREAEVAYLGFPINFYGIHTDQIYVDEAGVVGVPTGDSEVLGHPFEAIAGSYLAVIAPFWADAQIEQIGGVAGGSVSYSAATWGGHTAFAVHWNNMDYFDRGAGGHVSKSNTFELYLVDRHETGAGNFDIVFKYDYLEWDTADGDGGEGGLASTDPNVTPYPARAGWSRGIGDISGTSSELDGSGQPYGLIEAWNGQTYTKAIRNPEYKLTVTDTVSQAKLEDTDNDPARPGGILGAVTREDDGLGHLNIKLEQTGGDVLGWTNYWQAVDATPTPASGSFTPTGDVNVTVGPSGQAWTVRVTNLFDPVFERDIKVVVASLRIVWDGMDITDLNGNALSSGTDMSGKQYAFYAGQHISLRYELTGTDGPVSNRWWNVTNFSDLVKGYHAQDDSGDGKGYVIPLTGSDEDKSYASFYGVADVAGRVIRFSVDARIGGRVVHLRNKTTITIKKPGQSIWAGPPVAGGAIPGIPNPNLFQVSGYVDPAHWDGGITTIAEWETSLPTPPRQGIVSFVQLVNLSYDNGIIEGRTWTNGTFQLDTSYPYNSLPDADADSDTPIARPSRSLLSAIVTMDFTAWDWLMWTPPGGDSIAVPIQRWSWGVEARADWGVLTGWIVIPDYPRARMLFHGMDTTEFPEWNKVLRLT